ncbi:MAG: GNAT family N-acetyltransferase [Clostridiales bacterium]|jgi:GNAT superfamily N-acetyltransferase|nr:GNAT family N-acetyltransferase [Clostridiales bacterium]
MIRGKFLTSMDDISEVLGIRSLVFAEYEPDEFDRMAVYALAFGEDDRPAGTGRLFIDRDGRFRIGRVCVLPDARGNGLGDLILRMLLFRARELNAASVYVDVDPAAEGVFARYGFRTHEAGALARMRAAAEDIDLGGSCAGCGGGPVDDPECY